MEMAALRRLLTGRTSRSLINFYGPGGIGKSSLGLKFERYARRAQFPLSRIEGDRPGLTTQMILYEVMEGVVASAAGGIFDSGFSDFKRDYFDFLAVQDVLKRGGGANTLYDVIGNIKDPLGLTKTIAEAGKALTQRTRKVMEDRDALGRYLNRSEEMLMDSLAAGLEAGITMTGRPIVLLVDAYEHMEGLDGWFCRTLVRKLPGGVKVVLLGRNALTQLSFDWNDYGDAVLVKPLKELNPADTRLYLSRHGLSDVKAQENLYRVTGGYPLLLVLVAHLAREAGGWDKVGGLEVDADRDRIASGLLNRILQEERVGEVRAFLEKGVVAAWFNPELVSRILEVSAEDGRAIYEKLSGFSFVERHPMGLCFHEKIRELLLHRLRFGSEATFEQLRQRVMEYLRDKSGIAGPEQVRI